MPRYKPVDRSPRFLPVVLSEQIVPGSFELTLDYLIDYELDFSDLDARFENYDPRVMLKIVLLRHCRGLTSSRSIERACQQNVQFRAISGDRAPTSFGAISLAVWPHCANSRAQWCAPVHASIAIVHGGSEATSACSLARATLGRRS